MGAAAMHLGATIARLGIAAPTAPSTSCVALHGPSPSIHPCGSSKPKPFVYITIHLPSQSRRTSLQHTRNPPAPTRTSSRPNELVLRRILPNHIFASSWRSKPLDVCHPPAPSSSLSLFSTIELPLCPAPPWLLLRRCTRPRRSPSSRTRSQASHPQSKQRRRRPPRMWHPNSKLPCLRPRQTRKSPSSRSLHPIRPPRWRCRRHCRQHSPLPQSPARHSPQPQPLHRRL